MALVRIHPQSRHCVLEEDGIVDATELLGFVMQGGLLELRGNMLEIDGDPGSRAVVLIHKRGVIGNTTFTLPIDKGAGRK